MSGIFKSLALLAVLLAAVPCFSQGRVLEVRYGFGRTSSDPVPGEGAAQAIAGVLATAVVDSVRIEGFASPDGPAPRNRALSLRRALAVKDILASGLPEGTSVAAEGRGEHWDAVVRYVTATDDPLVAAVREDVLAVCGYEPDLDRREWLLRGRWPATWDVVREAVYDEVRCAIVTLWYHPRAEVASVAVKEEKVDEKRLVSLVEDVTGAVLVSLGEAPTKEAQAADVAVADEAIPAVEVSPAGEPAPEALAPVLTPVSLTADIPAEDWRMAFRTNLLLPALNVGAEVSLGRHRHFVLGADFYYPWMQPFDRGRTWCVEALAWDVNALWYMREGSTPDRRATGFYLGLEASAAYYDLGIHSLGIQGEAAAAALTLGWTWRIGRCRLGLGVSGGYMMSRFREYYLDEGTPFRMGDGWKTVRWIGPTKVDLTLKIPIWYRKS